MMTLALALAIVFVPMLAAFAIGYTTVMIMHRLWRWISR